MAEEKIMENNSGLGATGNFIHNYIQEDLKGELNKINTRFPPEPNGYLHIGHAKSICLNFGLAKLYGGKCNLRFDDTNPTKEDVEYVESIQEDVKWLGFDWEDRLYYASSYFDKYYEVAVKLIKEGKAFVCELTAEETAILSRAHTVFGCDICQTVCPMNRNVAETENLFSDDILSTVTPENVEKIYKSRPFGWRGLKVLQRNIDIYNKKDKV